MAIKLRLSNFANFASNYLYYLLMSRRSGILLFNSRDTCARCLGSIRRFNVNMGFNDDDRILIENLYLFKGYSAKKNLLKSFQIKVGL